MKNTGEPRIGAGSRIASGICAILVTVLASSCWHPTFDPMLSASEITIRKLGEPKLYFTVETWDQNGIENAWFLPPKDEMPAVGLLAMDMGEKINFKLVSTIDPLNHTGSLNTFNNFETSNTMDDAYLVQAYPDGTPNALVTAKPAEGRSLTMSPLTSSAITLPSTTVPFGIGAVALAGTSQASLSCFVYPAVDDPRYEIVTWDAGSPTFAATLPMTFSNAAQATIPGKFLAASSYLYLSCGLSDGSRAIYRWVNPPAASEPSVFSEVHGPLIGALSDGRLLAERDGVISVLDAGLNRLFKFPAGTLRFVHERYDTIDLKMKAVFTRTSFARYNSHDSNGQLRIEIHEIPTADLVDLAD
jgi:hypothetical protein